MWNFFDNEEELSQRFKDAILSKNAENKTWAQYVSNEEF